MNAFAETAQPSRIVVLVGVDMSDVSEHLLTQTRAIIRPVEEAEIHVVHVVSPEPPFLRLVRPSDEKDAGSVYEVERAQAALEGLVGSLGDDPKTRVFLHTPVGAAVNELTRIASEVGADILVIEAHEHDSRDPLRMFRRSVVDHIASTAPCTVLTIRRPQSQAPMAPMPPEAMLPPGRGPRETWPSPSH
jgi:nucleotide-binding universal stress UspA family protein